jgi:hypothetical protein
MERRPFLQRSCDHLCPPSGLVFGNGSLVSSLNGPLAEEELPEDEPTATDYAIGKKVIYVAFAWSKAELAYQTTLSIAAKHNLGFFDVSSKDEEVWLPAAGRLMLAHQRRSPGLLK